MEKIDWKAARTAGALYLVAVVTGMFNLIYVPGRIIVHGDIAATIDNIVRLETLYRIDIAVAAVGGIAFLALPLFLYKLLGGVDRTAAAIMVVLVMVGVSIGFVDMTNQLDLLSLVFADAYRQLLPPDQWHAMAKALLDSSYHHGVVAELFWGLWLFPFGYLVFRCGFLPRLLGILLMLGCFGYLAEFFGPILFPHRHVPDIVILPSAIGEIGICLWLLIVGARRAGEQPG
jgi:hypothetical protein